MIRNGLKAVAGSKGRTCRRLTVPCSGRACRLANELKISEPRWKASVLNDDPQAVLE
jgi:hypothetical protein